jgi:hypothetical protein
LEEIFLAAKPMLIPALYELALACCKYDATSYNGTYSKFCIGVNYSLDLNIIDHRKKLITLLNAWRCRLPEEVKNKIIQEIGKWYDSNQNRLPKKNALLWEMTKNDLNCVGEAYEALLSMLISFRPTCTSKILFALRPESLVPWDTSIRNQLRHDGSPASYIEYLCFNKSIILEIEKLCKRNGFDLIKLPEKLGYPNLSVAMIINQYYMIAFTIKSALPKLDLLKRWTSWS